MSPLTQGRGLKHFTTTNLSRYCAVAPHAGAWIETSASLYNAESIAVAPHAGAWIETIKGLKQSFSHLVAPHAGAWIETLALNQVCIPI